MVNDESTTQVRLADFNGILPSLTGKVELLYEGEQEGAEFVAQQLINNAIKTLYNTYFPEIKKLEKKDEKKSYEDIVNWFIENKSIEILDDSPDNLYKEELLKIKPLRIFVKKHTSLEHEKDLFFLMELVLWALSIHKKLSKNRFEQGNQFQDMFGDFIKGL
jgi:magnesium chelatase subunit I